MQIFHSHIHQHAEYLKIPPKQRYHREVMPVQWQMKWKLALSGAELELICGRLGLQMVVGAYVLLGAQCLARPVGHC